MKPQNKMLELFFWLVLFLLGLYLFVKDGPAWFVVAGIGAFGFLVRVDLDGL